MSLPELSSIVIKRKILELTQKQLAQEADVSQSLIAKIESGKIEPSYSIAKRIFETLHRLESGKQSSKEKTIKEIMTSNIIYCTSSQTIREASKKLIKNDISQLPIFEGEKVVGTITERCIIDAQSKYGEVIAHMPINKIMEPPLPLLDTSTSASILYSFMRHYQAVLVTEKGKVVGIISRADLMRR